MPSAYQADAAGFFAEMVRPTVAAFMKEPDNKRLGCLACLVLASMSDHFFHTPGADVEGHRDANSYRRRHQTATWAVGTVIGVANATKHVLERPGRVGFGAVFTDDIDCGNAQCGWPISGREVMVDAGARGLWLLSQLAEEAESYWAGKLAAHARGAPCDPKP